MQDIRSIHQIRSCNSSIWMLGRNQVFDNVESPTKERQVSISNMKPENNEICTSEDETEKRPETETRNILYEGHEHKIPHPPPTYPQTPIERRDKADLKSSTQIDNSITGNRRPQSARHRRRVRQINTTKRPQSAGLPSLRQPIDGCYSDEMDAETEQEHLSRSLSHTATT